MKKALIAGAASAVLAAMPVVGVFADNTTTHTDTLNLVLAEVCTLGTVTQGAANADDSTTHAAGTGSWSNDTLTANVAAGNTYANLGTTTFTVRCNDNDGFSLKAKAGTIQSEAGALADGAGNYILSSAGTGFAAATSESYWNFMLGNATTGVTIAEGYDAASALPTNETTVVASTAAAGNLNAGQNVTVTYGAGINNAQPAGTYTGTVVYTLVQNS